jgi:hypothetical protein
VCAAAGATAAAAVLVVGGAGSSPAKGFEPLTVATLVPKSMPVHPLASQLHRVRPTIAEIVRRVMRLVLLLLLVARTRFEECPATRIRLMMLS